jgi:hypothetical protein
MRQPTKAEIQARYEKLERAHHALQEWFNAHVKGHKVERYEFEYRSDIYIPGSGTSEGVVERYTLHLSRLFCPSGGVIAIEYHEAGWTEPPMYVDDLRLLWQKHVDHVYRDAASKIGAMQAKAVREHEFFRALCAFFARCQKVAP